ncbi:response regulator [Caenimonas sedimenti]|uniref:histidine kinase n=2 Tax=Caenimonas sedimenti TaxID=2596921 RepID=A0A562ZP99_9BURK|nr:response regulator [Caenimonas sedimenti]
MLPVLAYAGVGFYRYHRIAADTELRLDRALRVAHEHALKVLDTNDILLARVMDASGVEDAASLRAREPALHQQLQAMSRNRPQIQSIWIRDASGEAVATDRASPPPPEPGLADRGDVGWHLDHPGGLFVSDVMVGGESGTKFFDMSRGRRDREGRFLGVVSAGLTPAYFEKLHRDLVADEPGLALTMFREDGSILSRWPQLRNGPGRLAPDSPVMSRVRTGETAGAAHGVSSVDGRKRLLFFRKVGGYPIYIGTGMDTREIARRWLDEMAWLAAFGLPPLLGLYLAARAALRRTRDSLEAAQQLHTETVARRRVEEALVQAQKLEALGRLTGGVAHDFNNALMVISNNVALMKLKHPDTGGPQLESIGRAVGSATKLTRQLLAFSRRQALVPQVLRLQDQLPLVKDLLTPVLGSRVELAVDVAPDTQAILVDPAEFELALINLAINARDAMPGGGRFALRARNTHADQLPPLLQGAMVVIEVSDSGTGIAPDVLAKVFEPFFTTKPVGEGTGLGLSQVYGLCQRAGGTATVDSELGVGTTVRLFFPAAVGRAATAGDRGPALERHLDLTVLLAEDNDDVAGVLRQVLDAMGCKVTRYHRAQAAADHLAACAPNELPDVLLSDVVMPGEMDGMALALQVRRRHPEVRIVLMTGYAEQLEAIAQQGFTVLPKPCSAEMLAQALKGE